MSSLMADVNSFDAKKEFAADRIAACVVSASQCIGRDRSCCWDARAGHVIM